MILSVAPLFGPYSVSSRIKTEVREKLLLPKDFDLPFTPTSEFSGRIEVFRTDTDVVVLLKDACITGKVQCAKCLREESITISFTNSEQIFYSEGEREWGEEDFRIDGEKETIHLTPFFWQEIAVHIPDPFRHPEGKCDADMLRKISNLQENTTPSPFADLKNLLTPKQMKKISGKKLKRT